MKKFSLICDSCGETVENLYTINFKATEDSEGGDFYLPDVEICENCVDELCDAIKELVFYDKEDYSYDNDNNRTKYTKESYSGIEWYMYEQTLYTYDNTIDISDVFGLTTYIEYISGGGVYSPVSINNPLLTETSFTFGFNNSITSS